MSARFVRQSSYRHVYGQSTKREHCYDNIRVSASAWDTNLAAVNPKYIAVNYQASGGGAFLVCPLGHSGKLPDVYPLCRAHSAPVLDTAWSPFDDDLIASVGEDGNLSLTRIDAHRLEQALSAEHTDIVSDLEPVVKFAGHGRKAGHVKWHPSAQSVLATASLDIKIWDVEKGVAAIELPSQPDMVASMSFNWTGTLLATTCKDKKLRVFDLRSGKVSQIADSHTGIKGSRVEWMGRLDRLCTTGFSKLSDRQVYIWDSGNIAKGSLFQLLVDTSSGALMPFWSDNDILFLAGKGDGNIRYYEYEADELFLLSEYRASEPQRGLCWIPRRGLNTHDCEIARAYKVTNNLVEPIPFIVPRKSDSFQSDIYPPAPSIKPALSAADFFGGKTSDPILVNLQNQQAMATPPVKTGVCTAPTPASTTSAPYTASPSSTLAPVDTHKGRVSPGRSDTSDQGGDRLARSPGSTPSGLAGLIASGVSAVMGPRPLPPSPQDTTTSTLMNQVPSSSTSSNQSGGGGGQMLELQKENSSLRGEIARKDQKIQILEAQLQRMKLNQAKIRDLTTFASEG